MSNYEWNYLSDTVKDIYYSDPSKIVYHQINSFNNFIETIIPNTIFRQSPIVVGTGWDEEKNDYAKKSVVEFTRVSMCAPMQQDGPNDPIRPLYPYEARMRNLTYSSQMFVDLKHSYYSDFNVEPIVDIEKNVPICKIPVMLRSNYCNLKINNTVIEGINESTMDYGGYFIVNGNEKVLIGQERMAENSVFCFEPKKDQPIICEIKSTKDQLYFPVKNITVIMSQDSKVDKFSGIYTLKVKLPSMAVATPLFVVFRALGIESDKDIFDIILRSNIEDADTFLLNTTEVSAMEMYDLFLTRHSQKGENTSEIFSGVSQNDALVYLSGHLTYNTNFLNDENDSELVKNEKKITHVKNILDRDFFPHLGNDTYKKALFLGYMTKYLIDCYIGKRNYDNRDNIQNKRVDLAGPMLTQIFRTQFLNLIRDIKVELSKIDGHFPTMKRIVQSSSIEQKMKFGLSTGNWPTMKGSSAPQSKKGIAQVLSRMSYLGTISHLRRNISPLESSGSKLDKPRKIYASHTGYICPNETPEGAQVGIVKNMSMTCEVTIPTNIVPVLYALENKGMVSIESVKIQDLQKCIYIFVNGDLVGFADDETIGKIYEDLLTKRRHGELSIYMSVKYRVDQDELFISTSGGRYTRPLFIVENNEVLLLKRKNIESSTWNDLLVSNEEEKTLYNGAVIEYVDTVELEKSLIALNSSYLDQNENNTYLEYTHCEIDPSMWLSVIAGCIPASDHNPSPRNCYQSSMGKQAIGIFSTDYNLRMDTNTFILGYPQKPLVSTKTMRYIGFDKLPHGSQVILAICTYGGYNQEDSLSINKSAIQRGLFNTMFFRTYQTDQNKNKTHNSEKICRPNNANTKLMAPVDSYNNLENNGIARIGSYVQGGDVIIGKTVSTSKNKYSESKNIDASVMLRKTEKGVVDRVIPNEKEPVSINSDGNQLIKVRVVDYREPIMADKFASRHAQKGTVGMMYNEADMPFTGDGIIPDFIMNPHAIPSRMTVGQILETLLGKVGSVMGREMDATTFSKIDTEMLFKYLREYDFHEQCEEVMYNGMTGLQMNSTIFIGPTYYQRLKHMVEDKIHSRISGQVHTTTRQPTEGRSRDGGLRLGEMERDAMLAHGAVQFLKERFMDASDIFRVFVSKTEQCVVVANPEENIYKYGTENIPKDDVVEVQLPYAMKLLLHEMMAMGIDPRIVV